MQNLRSTQNTRQPLLLAAAAVILCVVAVIACLSGCPAAPVNCAQLPDPGVTVGSFFDLMKQGQFGRCDAFLLDFSLSDMEQAPQGDMSARFRSLLTQSYDCTLSGKSELSGLTARQPVTVTYLDLPAFGAAVREEANRIAGELSFQGTDISSEEKAMEIAALAIDSMSEGISRYYFSAELILELRYTDGEWMILYSPELERMIMGNSTGL